jgi:hypothetical protein
VGTVKFADGSVVSIQGIGTVLFECKDGEHCSITCVYYIPRLTTSIFSIGQLADAGYEVLIRKGVMSLRDPEQRLLARINCSPGRLYKLELKLAHHVCLSTCAGSDAWLWYAWFAHMNFASLRKMGSVGNVRGLPALEQVNQLFEACLAGKQR